MTHLSLEELLALRDGEAAAEAQAHLATCPVCATEFDRLVQVRQALRELPAAAPDRDVWPAVHEAAARARQHRRWVRAGWAAAGFAALVTVVAGVRGGVEAWHEASLARATRTLVAESRQLEEQLRAAGRERRVVSGREAETVSELEDRLAVVDARLAARRDRPVAPQDEVNLWQERVELLHALLDTCSTRAAYAGL